MRVATSRRLAVVSAVVTGLLAGAVPARAQTTGPPKILLAFDASGSMKSRYGAGGQTKIQAAQEAAVGLLDELPAQTQVGLRVFGGGRPSRPIGPACQDSRLVLPIGPLNRGDAERQIRSFRARGRTPITFALRQAAKDLGSSGSRTIVLVSDGQDTCQPPPPCDVAREIANGGVDLRIQAIGLNVDRAARQQLKCIAAAGGGVYRDAADAGSLREELRTLSTRALRQYVARGTPIRGGRSAREAKMIAPGRYVDAMPGDSERWYAVQLATGESLKASASFIPPNREVADKAQYTDSSMDIVTPSFDIPASQNSSASGSPFERRGYVDGEGVVSRPIGVGAQAQDTEPFHRPGRYFLKLKLTDNDSKDLFNAIGGKPVELELSVEVLGRKGGAPPPATPGGGTTAIPRAPSPLKAAAAPDEPPSAPLLALIGLGTGALGVAIGAATWRRRTVA